jgi:phosphatidylinositol alpha 1,6-mannosyltransferase
LTQPLRVALFADAFHEANGVATVSREFASFAERRELPFFCVRGGPKTLVVHHKASTTVEIKRSRAAFSVDRDLYFDPLLSRYRSWVIAQLRPFDADLVHIMGPGDMGVLGWWVAHCLKIPLVASWHTNLHEYAGCRLEKFLAFLPERRRREISGAVERLSLRACVSFYARARFLLAPNQDMVALLEKRTHRPAFLMAHGVDTEIFSPARCRSRPTTFCIGYVGRLTPEKNVRLLAGLEQRLIDSGRQNFRFLVVGDGSEKEWLQKNLHSGEFPGILHDTALADAFASMDVFVFPSRTDTFGLVLLEALASGVPVVASAETCTRVGIRCGVTGFFAAEPDDFADSVLQLMTNESTHSKMRSAAREFACLHTWSAAFEDLYQTYQTGLEAVGLARARM